MKAKNFFLMTGAALLLAALSSCTEDIEDDAYKGRSLFIEVSESNDDGGTRASFSNLAVTFQSGDRIGLYCVKGSTVLVSNACYTYNGSSWSTSSHVEYNSDYTYYAYYPYVASPYSPDFSSGTVDGIFSSFLTDASNKFHNANQSTAANFMASDLMIARGTAAGSNTVTFSMTHKKGLAVFDGDGAADATFTGNIPYLNGTKKYFIMKPATLTSFTDDEGTYSLYASAGRYVTHNIAESYSDFILTVTGPTAYDHSGGTNTYSVTSYKQNSSGTKTKAVPWTATYSTDGGSSFSSTKPTWLTAFTASGDGSTSASNYSATVAAQTYSSGSSGTASSILSGRADVGTSSDYYDLSTLGGTASRTTANCYMVHAPGYYKFPLVYGNAIKNNADNTAAYNNTAAASSATFLRPFINHAGTGITAPWITKSGTGVNGGMGITVDGVELIWQDKNGLIEKSTLQKNGDFIQFHITSSNIAEANAVIAAKSGSTIVWLWHIWVTPETYENTVTVNGYDVTPVNLGWVGSGSVSTSGYEGRSCIVKITQTGGEEHTFTVTQTEEMTTTVSQGGYSPYYQWGRLVPEIPSNGSSNSNHAAYNIDGNTVSITQKSFTSTGTGADYGSIENGIKYPLYHYYNNISGNSGQYGPFQTWQYNLWDGACTAVSGNRTNKTVKTIYDPCPPGFCVPTSGLYYYMGQSTNYSTHRSAWDSSNCGYMWDTLWFPAAGYRNSSSGTSPSNVRSGGYYWSATPNSSNNGYNLSFNSSDWNQVNNDRANGFSVRPVAE